MLKRSLTFFCILSLGIMPPMALSQTDYTNNAGETAVYTDADPQLYRYYVNNGTLNVSSANGSALTLNYFDNNAVLSSTAVSTTGEATGIWVADLSWDNTGSGNVTISGTGSALGNGYGIRVEQNWNNSGSGLLTATGAGVDGGKGYGVYLDNGSWTNSATASVNASGTGAGGYGIHVNNGEWTNTSRGSVTAIGKDGGHGIYIADNWTNNPTSSSIDNATSTIAASGDNGTGIAVGGNWYNGGVSSLSASGDHGGTGIYIGGAWTNAGAAVIIASGDNSSTGIHVTDNWTNAGGSVTATGNNTGTGISTGGVWTHSGKYVAAAHGYNGGTGISVGTDWINSSSGGVVASGESGGVGIIVHGGWSNTSAATVTASGASGGTGISVSGNWDNTGSGVINAFGDGGNGIYVGGDWTNDGKVVATGVSGGAGISLGSGAWVNNGSINAIGNSGGYGVSSVGSWQNAGAVVADGSGGVGMVFESNMGALSVDNIAGGNITLIGSGSSGSASLRLIQHDMNAAGITFRTGSLLNISKGGVIDLVSSGSATTGASLTIEDGASLVVLDASALGKNESSTYNFITGNGNVTINGGGFDMASGPLFSYNASYTGSGATLTVTRLGYASDLISDRAVSGWFSQLEQQYKDVSGDNLTQPWAKVLYNVENGADTAAIISAANLAHRQTTAQATAQSIPLLASLFHQNGRGFDDELSVAMTNKKYGSLSFGLNPLYYSGKRTADSGAYSDIDALSSGLTLGVMYSPADFIFGVNASYMHTKLTGDEYKADGNSLRLSGGAGRYFELPASAKIWTGINAAFTRYDLDQTRNVTAGVAGTELSNTSKPTVNVYGAGVSLKGDIPVFSRLYLRPATGVDYAVVQYGGYTEIGAMGLQVNPEKHRSLMSTAGLEIMVPILLEQPEITFSVKGGWHHELMDRYAALSTSATELAGLDTKIKSEKQGRDLYSVGGSLSTVYQYTSVHQYIGINGEYLSGDKYDSYEIGLVVKWIFKGGAY